jgi:hypothetical protein
MVEDLIALLRDDDLPGTLSGFVERFPDDQSCADLLRSALACRPKSKLRGVVEADETYQGAVSRKHLPAYLEEYAFRFNRRTSKSRGLLFQRLLTAAVARPSPFYWEIVGRPDGQTPLYMAA